MGGYGAGEEAAGGGGGGGLSSLLPWPLPTLVGMLPPQLLMLLAMVLFFQSAAFLMRYALYFMPVLWFAPGNLKLPLCFMIWGGIMSGHLGAL